ncbi:MAG: hypothetical protein P4M10_06990, partial [Verrucomicrobiae bacterium]|nr:hypothetical protein [Verrucomicrobiae bacterium]
GAWIACEAGRTGWLAYERIGLAVLFWTPLAIKPASVHGLPLGPVALLGLAALVGRRAWRRGAPCVIA